MSWIVLNWQLFLTCFVLCLFSRPDLKIIYPTNQIKKALTDLRMHPLLCVWVRVLTRNVCLCVCMYWSLCGVVTVGGVVNTKRETVFIRRQAEQSTGTDSSARGQRRVKWGVNPAKLPWNPCIVLINAAALTLSGVARGKEAGTDAGC